MLLLTSLNRVPSRPKRWPALVSKSLASSKPLILWVTVNANGKLVVAARLIGYVSVTAFANWFPSLNNGAV